MNNPAKDACGPIPESAVTYLRKIANKDLSYIQALTQKVHSYFEKREAGEINLKEFNKAINGYLYEMYNHIQNLSNLNVAFPTLFNDQQLTVLLDLMQVTTQLNLEYPNPEIYTEFHNGQIGGAVTILQQQWAA